MSKISVNNGTDGLLCLFLEPWGTDHWMRPGDNFTVVTHAEPVECPFDVVMHGQGISVMVNSGGYYDVVVVDQDGNPAPCGHQRPADIGW
ncbi:hypothetical protein PV410_39935 [Streptomyces sp. PA03-5A]|nr:hypothetical protein [Streptomyces sp. PA03-5A]